MRDYNKIYALEDLERVSKLINTLNNVYKNRKKMDNESLDIIKGLYNTVQDIYTHEMKKELQKQKKEVKQFPTEEEIDKLINDIIKE